MLAISQTVLEVIPVTQERFRDELRYQVMLCFASALRDAGIVDQNDISVIETLLREKYQPVFKLS